MKRGRIYFFFIIVLATLLRIYHLGQTPAGLEWDEVALGYDAFSILKTGRDQFGEFLPISFRSLDDWKPPLYVYAAIPGIAIFSLTDFATRLPSAIFGTTAVILVYFFVMELFSGMKKEKKRLIALFSSLFLAISPWHLQFSRAAFETNLSVTVTLSAVLFFLKGIRQNRMKLFYFSSFLFGLSFFSYHSTRVVTPVILIFLFIIFKNKLPKKKSIVIFFLIYSVFVYLFIPIATSKDAQIRFRVTNDFNMEKYTKQSAVKILEGQERGIEYVHRLFHNRRLAIFNYENVKNITRNYISHFSPSFLFVKGDAPLHHAPGFGHMYFFDLPLLFIGVFLYFFKLRRRENLILLVWLLAAPIPASVTWQAPHSVRAEIILPTLQIFSAIGFVGLLDFLKKESRILYSISIPFFIFIFVYGFSWYLHQYYLHTNFELSKEWMYGRKEAVEYTEELKDRYDSVIVSLKVDMPHVFWLFYTRYNPKMYLKEGGTVSGGFAEEANKFDKYEFRNFNYEEVLKEGKYLLVGLPQEFPSNAKILKTVYYLNGEPGIIIAESK